MLKYKTNITVSPTGFCTYKQIKFRKMGYTNLSVMHRSCNI